MLYMGGGGVVKLHDVYMTKSRAFNTITKTAE